MRDFFSYLVIAFGGAVEPEGSAVPLFMAVPLVPDVDVACSGVGFVFTPGTPVAPPWAACSGVGLVLTATEINSCRPSRNGFASSLLVKHANVRDDRFKSRETLPLSSTSRPKNNRYRG